MTNEYTLTREEAFKLAGLGDIIEKETGAQVRLHADNESVLIEWRPDDSSSWGRDSWWYWGDAQLFRVIPKDVIPKDAPELQPKRYMKDLCEMETPGLKAVVITGLNGREQEFLKSIGWTEFKYVYADFALRHGLSVEMVFEGDA